VSKTGLSESNYPPLPLIKKILDVRDGKNKTFIFVEGRRLIEELIKSNIHPTDGVVVRSQFKIFEKLIRQSANPAGRIYTADEKLMSRISAHDTPPGLLCLAKRPPTVQTDWKNPLNYPLILLMHRIQNPQNVGALVRTAEAAGVTEVWTSPQTCDPFSSKALRGSMGGAFRIPIRPQEDLSESLKLMTDQGLSIYAAMKDGKNRFDMVDFKKPSVIILGNEGQGMPEEEIKYKAITVKIPMKAGVESLNVGVAGALLLYEALRQRGGFSESS